MEQKKQSLHKIILFVCYTFFITWSFWFLIIFCNKYFNTLWYGESLFWIPYTIGSLGPAISAYLIYQKFKESYSEKSFLKYIFKNPINSKIWLVFILFLIWRILMIWIAFGISKPISILAIFINLPFLIVLGGLEELGWRGILQPKLENLISYIPSIFLVSIIWSFWHLPLWFIKGTVQSGFPFGLYFVSSLVLTASFTTLYKYTNNLFLCILNHAWFNGCIGLALYVGNDGNLQLNLNWKVIVVFSVEMIVSVILGKLYNNKKRKQNVLI